MIGVLNTRPRAPGEPSLALSEALRAHGFEPIDVPLVELVLLLENLSLLRKVSAAHYDGILLTSPNLLPLLRAAGENVPEAWRDKPWHLVGPGARADVEALGARVAFVPQEPSLDGFLREFPMEDKQRGLRLLHPCSAKTRLEPAVFAARGIHVHNMAVYEPRCPAGAAAALIEAWPRAQAALFASGSAVHHLFVAAPQLARSMARATAQDPKNGEDLFPISIGASTSRALRMYGIENFTQAPTADNAGFIAALHSIFPDSPVSASPT